MNIIKKSDDIMTSSSSSSPTPTPEKSLKGEKKKKSIIPRIFSSKRNGRESSEEDILQPDEKENDLDRKITSRGKYFMEAPTSLRRGFSERHSSLSIIESLNLLSCDQTMAPSTITQDIRVFVGTWNVGGNTPKPGLSLEDFLQVEGSADIYVLGFQEIVPLSAGNVLVMEDNEPASKWVALISHALNKSYHDHESSSYSSCSTNSKHSKNNNNNGHKELSKSNNNIFHKSSLKALSKNLRVDEDQLKSCNCTDHDQEISSTPIRRRARKFGATISFVDPSINEFILTAADHHTALPELRLNYQLVASKQMVGIFLSVWSRKELVNDIGHLRISCIGRGIMGYLGNKGCISVSMTLHQTSFCFVCSHLASGEREGDELRRNSDVVEIMKGIQFPNTCKIINPSHRIPERIVDHDRMIWLGDLNYRVGLSYEETRLFLEENDWDSLLQKDQLNVEREAGRVFSGWNEGKILFAPTYKYSNNSDSYAGETTKSKKKRRTPAWCDRILWRGGGIEQLSYIRGESRFSDHRPVCAVFAVEVETKNTNNNNTNTKYRKGYLRTGANSGLEDCIPQRHSLCEF